MATADHSADDNEKPLSPEQQRIVTKVRWLMLLSGVATLLGIAVMTVCNLLRILLILGAGVGVNRYCPLKYGRPFVAWAFHENIGWLIYLLAIWLLFRWLTTPKRDSFRRFARGEQQ